MSAYLDKLAADIRELRDWADRNCDGHALLLCADMAALVTMERERQQLPRHDIRLFYPEGRA